TANAEHTVMMRFGPTGDVASTTVPASAPVAAVTTASCTHGPQGKTIPPPTAMTLGSPAAVSGSPVTSPREAQPQPQKHGRTAAVVTDQTHAWRRSHPTTTSASM